MAAVSVLVATRNPGSLLPDLVRSIDAQTLPSAEFEVVLVDASSDGSAARLQQLAGRRPNVTVVAADAAGAEAERLDTALQRSTADHVLVLGQRHRLAPRALELLLDAARRTEADLVLGRVVTVMTSGSAVVPDDADRLDVSGVTPAGCLALIKRSLLAGRAQPGAALLDVAALLGGAGTVSAVGRYACAIEHGRPVVQTEAVSLESPAYRWGDGELHLTLRMGLAEAASTVPRAWLVLSQGPAEVAVPATVHRDEGEGTRLTASVALDPRTAEGGSPFQDGQWLLRLRLVWPGHEVTVPLPPGPARSAVLSGRPYVVRRAGLGLQLDAGATQSSVIGPVAKSRSSITESARGILVTLEYPTLHVPDDAVLDARLLLDRFSLPARLVCEGGNARLEAYASSLAGTSTVAVVAGGGAPVPTGLRLRVSGTGAMTFVNAPAPLPAPPGSTPSDAPLAQRLRRRMPGALEPLVYRLAQVPALREGYRRLISR
jgi:hypothetical protein